MSMSPLNEAKNILQTEINKSFELIQTVNQISHLKIDQVHSIYELSFLKMFLAWEFFLEKSFILYMLGKETDNGYKPNRYVSPKDENHAYELIKGGRSFPDWLSVDFIKEKSGLFFENGNPFKDILCNDQNINQDLRMMKTIRNRIVHISQKTKDEFSKILKDEFGYDLGIVPGEFLKKDKKSKKGSPQSLSYIEYFKNILLIVADNIMR